MSFFCVWNESIYRWKYEFWCKNNEKINKKCEKNWYNLLGSGKIFFLLNPFFSNFFEFLKIIIINDKPTANQSMSRRQLMLIPLARTCSMHMTGPCQQQEHIGGQQGAVPSARTTSFHKSTVVDALIHRVYCTCMLSSALESQPILSDNVPLISWFYVAHSMPNYKRYTCIVDGFL